MSLRKLLRRELSPRQILAILVLKLAVVAIVVAWVLLGGLDPQHRGVSLSLLPLAGVMLSSRTKPKGTRPTAAPASTPGSIPEGLAKLLNPTQIEALRYFATPVLHRPRKTPALVDRRLLHEHRLISEVMPVALVKATALGQAVLEATQAPAHAKGAA